MKTLLSTFLLVFFVSSFSTFAQSTGQINGTVTDSITGEPLIGANVYVTLNGSLFGTTSDPEGYYVLKPLQPGIYDVKVSYVGFTEKVIQGVRVSQNAIKLVNVQISNNINLPPIIVTTPKYDDLIRVEPIKSVPQELFEKPTLRGVENMVSILDGVFQSDEGGELYFRGSRPEATDYYIDNVRAIGDHSVPNSAIADIVVYSGGIPAMYGDVTGAVVVITTKSYNMYNSRPK